MFQQAIDSCLIGALTGDAISPGDSCQVRRGHSPPQALRTGQFYLGKASQRVGHVCRHRFGRQRRCRSAKATCCVHSRHSVGA
eukprot:scaffold299772_cov37-Prasinocladus_malaysianus.AAC.1